MRLLILMLSTLFVISCASKQVITRRYVNDRTKVHVYQKPVHQIWPEVRAYIFEKGWKLSDKSLTDKSYYFETDWAPTGLGDGEVRYLFQLIDVDGTASRLQINSTTKDEVANITTSVREIRMEWELLKRIDRPAAILIKKGKTFKSINRKNTK